MRSWVNTIVKYTLGLVLLYVLINYALFKIYEAGIWHPFNSKAVPGGAGGDGFTLQRWKEWEKTTELSMVFAGSSHAYRSFHAPWIQQQGVSCFNWGSTAQTPLNTYYLLKNLHLREKQTQWVVLDVFYALMLDNKGMESAFDLNTNTPVTMGLWGMNFRSGDPTTFNHRLATAIDQIWYPLSHRKQHKIPEDQYKGLGYVEHLSDKEADSTEMINAIHKHKSYSVSEKQFYYLEKCTQWLQSQGIKVMWCSQPLPPIVIENDPLYPTIQKRFQESAKLLGIPFWDLSLSGNEFHFFDWHHLNASSALQYTQRFWKNFYESQVIISRSDQSVINQIK